MQSEGEQFSSLSAFLLWNYKERTANPCYS